MFGPQHGPGDTRPPNASPDTRDELRNRRIADKPGRVLRNQRRMQSEQASPKQASSRQAMSKKAKSIRGRRQRELRVAPGRPNNRIKIVLGALLLMLVVATIKLSFIQGWDSSTFAARAENQYSRTDALPAQRGTITDRNGTELAFTIEGRAIAARPSLFVDDNQRRRVINVLVNALGATVNAEELMASLVSGKSYVYLARGLMPDQSAAIMTQIGAILGKDNANAVVTERQDLRQYPDGGLARSVVGDTSTWNGHGSMGIESKFDSLLAGTDGSRTVDVYGGGVIPGSARDEVVAANGSDLQLTLDFDLQYTVGQTLKKYVDQVGAKRGMAVVEDVKTGQVYAINTYQPGATAAEALSNIAVTSPFEPGSVNKVVTFAAALDAGLITPTTSLKVDDSVQLGGRTIHDAWSHGEIEMTATGILAKSSNVGTLHIANEVGPDAYAAELKKFGLGTKTGIELGGESAGELMDESQWSTTTFANLPIGQGLSMTLVQLASMYQAIGNNGVRLAPTLVVGTDINGHHTASAPQPGTTVMTASTAQTLLGMLRGTVQDGDIGHKGTAAGAQINGYQVAGKTGTAQQVVNGKYSNTAYTSTFAGLVPADNPRFVIAIMLDAPQNGKNSVPLFHDIAAYAMRAFDVAPSATPAPIYDLYLNY